MRAFQKKLHLDSRLTIAYILFLYLVATRQAIVQGVPGEAAGVWAATILLNLAFLGFFLVGTRRLGVRTLAQVLYYAAMYVVLDAFVPTLGVPDGAQTLRDLDGRIFGHQPADDLHTVLPTFFHEVFAVGYALFLPYLYFNVLRSICRDGPVDARRFLVGLVAVYAIGYVGYVLLPAYGPRFFDELTNGGRAFLGITAGPPASRALSGFMDGYSGHQNVFPSLHAAGSLYVWVFELRYRSRRLGLLSTPIVAGVWIGTVYHGYHYVVDLLAALVLVLIGHIAARVAVKAKTARKVAAREARHRRGRP